jgi:hypothetical protein
MHHKPQDHGTVNGETFDEFDGARQLAVPVVWVLDPAMGEGAGVVGADAESTGPIGNESTTTNYSTADVDEAALDENVTNRGGAGFAACAGRRRYRQGARPATHARCT